MPAVQLCNMCFLDFESSTRQEQSDVRIIVILGSSHSEKTFWVMKYQK